MYRLITRHTIEEKIMGLQQFKVKTANTVISADNSSLQSMATERILDLFSLDPKAEEADADGDNGQQGEPVATIVAGAAIN